MRALLLAAGFGTRLRPLTDTVPKCLVQIHGRPLLDYWLDLIFKDGAISHAIINTHYLAEVVQRHMASSPWRERVTLVNEPELLGTGGTLVANRAALGSGPVMLAHADNLTTFDIAAFQAAHAARPVRAAMSMLAFRTDDPRSCGILELDEDNMVQAFHEKVAEPPGNLANAGVYIVEPEVTEAAARLAKPYVDLSTQVIPCFVGRILAHETSGYHRDIGNLSSLARAHAEYPGVSRPG
jgi:mannose-1-phosphate guanylyltransferase